MQFNALENLLTNKHHYKPLQPHYRQARLLNVFLLGYVIMAALFVVADFYLDSLTASILDAAFMLLVLGVFLFFRFSKKLTLSSAFFVFLVLVQQGVVFAVLGHQQFSFIWFSIIAPMSFFLLGKKKGLLISAFSLTMLMGYIIVTYKSWTPAEFDTLSIINIVSAMLALIFLVAYFEMSRSEAVELAQRVSGELERSNQALSDNREQLQLILDSTAEAVFGVGTDGRCTFCNAASLEILGYADQDELIGQNVHAVCHGKRPDQDELPVHECDILRTCIEGTPAYADHDVFWRSDGTSIDVEYRSYPQYKNARLVGAVVTFSDNSVRKAREKKIEYFSTHDTLTGLLNRSAFERLLADVDCPENLPISVILADVNGLKLTNDVFGHEMGDELLVNAAGILKKVCRDDDLIVRLGGDEFVIILPNTQHLHALGIIERITDMLEREKLNILQCSMSLGCDTKTNNNQHMSDIVKNAESAMYRQKAVGRSSNDTEMLTAIIRSLYEKAPAEERHSINVSRICRRIGEELELPETEIQKLRRVGLLHDIGKVSVGAELANVLTGTGVEYHEQVEQEHRQHPVTGYRILNIFESTVDLAEIVYSHHEQWDGCGYPRGLKGVEIPLMARIIMIAGRYDVLCQKYGAIENDKVVDTLRAESGSMLDPALVDLVIEMVEDGAL